MKFWILFLFVFGAKCDENGLYVVQRPNRAPLKVYWNVPTKQCRSKKIPFDDLFEKYGIIQNTGDKFIGDRISIMYDPGKFPALFKAGSSIRRRNGGVPQEGDLKIHLDAFKRDVEESIDKDFDGIGVIDFESWRPILRQNFGNLVPYVDLSYEIEREKHPWWMKSMIKSEAKRRFESSGKQFMKRTLETAKQLRPDAKWGYYAYPYCFNMARDERERCSDQVRIENDDLPWLWSESSALFPSVYSSSSLSNQQLVKMIRGRIAEAARLRTNDQPILPYFWFRHRDGGFLSYEDLQSALKVFYNSEATGFIIWGSSNDVNSEVNCTKLLSYVKDTLGPLIAAYTIQKTQKLSEEIIPTTNDIQTTEANYSEVDNDIKLTNESSETSTSNPQFIIQISGIAKDRKEHHENKNIVQAIKEWLFSRKEKTERFKDIVGSMPRILVEDINFPESHVENERYNDTMNYFTENELLSTENMNSTDIEISSKEETPFSSEEETKVNEVEHVTLQTEILLPKDVSKKDIPNTTDEIQTTNVSEKETFHTSYEIQTTTTENIVTTTLDLNLSPKPKLRKPSMPPEEYLNGKSDNVKNQPPESETLYIKTKKPHKRKRKQNKTINHLSETRKKVKILMLDNVTSIELAGTENENETSTVFSVDDISSHKNKTFILKPHRLRQSPVTESVHATTSVSLTDISSKIEPKDWNEHINNTTVHFGKLIIINASYISQESLEDPMFDRDRMSDLANVSNISIEYSDVSKEIHFPVTEVSVTTNTAASKHTSIHSKWYLSTTRRMENHEEENDATTTEMSQGMIQQNDDANLIDDTKDEELNTQKLKIYQSLLHKEFVETLKTAHDNNLLISTESSHLPFVKRARRHRKKNMKYIKKYHTRTLNKIQTKDEKKGIPLHETFTPETSTLLELKRTTETPLDITLDTTQSDVYTTVFNVHRWLQNHDPRHRHKQYHPTTDSINEIQTTTPDTRTENVSTFIILDDEITTDHTTETVYTTEKEVSNKETKVDVQNTTKTTTKEKLTQHKIKPKMKPSEKAISSFEYDDDFDNGALDDERFKVSGAQILQPRYVFCLFHYLCFQMSL